MGCAASVVPGWEAAETLNWPVYMIRRSVQRADLFAIELFRPGGERVLRIDVQQWCTPNGYVSAKSLCPAAVTASVDGMPTMSGP